MCIFYLSTAYDKVIIDNWYPIVVLLYNSTVNSNATKADSKSISYKLRHNNVANMAWIAE